MGKLADLFAPDSLAAGGNAQSFDARAITAAATQIQVNESGKSAAHGGLEWQKEALDYYDQVGELHYSTQFFTSCLRRLKLRIALRDKQNNVTAAWDDKDIAKHPQVELANQKLKELKPKIGGHGELLSQIGGNLVITGECYLVGDGEADAVADSWDVLSVEELKSDSSGFQKLDEKGGKVALNSPIDPIRIWNAHLRHSQKADSSVRPLLEILEEIVLLTRSVRATATSRLAGAGILFIPNEIEVPKKTDNTDPESDQFVVDLITTMVTPIKDKGSAAAVVPHVVRAPGAQIEKILHLDFTRNFDSYPAVELRKEAVRRFAQGINLPVEIVTGQGGTNHWNAWNIDESTFKVHIEPTAEIIVDGLTDWLHIVLPELEIKDGLEVIVHYDSNELVSRPDEGADANDAYDRGVINASRYRESKGFSDRDAPDDAELAKRIEWENARRGGQAQNGQPNSLPEESAALQRSIDTGIEVAVERAIERVGSQLRSKLNGKPATRAVLDGVRSERAAQHLGRERTTEILGDTPIAATEFNALYRATLALCRYAETQDPEGDAREAVGRAEKLAAARLFDHEAKLEAR